MSDGLEQGRVVGGYRIEGVLGRGGMGVVYRAEQVALGRPVALKVIAPELSSDPQFRARFDRESRMAASIDHPHVVPVYEAGQAGETAFLAMRFIDGTDLRSVLMGNPRVSVEQAVTVVAQVAAALDAAHAQGLVHRDVKPANVLVTGPLDDPHCYLTDFGLTKHTTSHGGLTRTGQWLGTPDYIAPEQVEGRSLDARADVYALGCILFETVAGRVPYPRESDIAKVYAHVHEQPPSASAANPAVPGELDAVIARALAKAPADRYPSAGDLARASRAALAGRDVRVPERSVAAGAAAPAGPPSQAATRWDPQPQPAPGPYAQPPGWTPVTAALPGSGGGGGAGRAGTALAIVLAALFLAGGGVAAALILSGGDEPAPATTTSAGAPQTGPEVKNPNTTSEVSAGFEPFAASTFDAQSPEGWTLVEDDEVQKDGRRVSKWSGPDGTTVLIDTTLDIDGDPADSAAKLEANYQSQAGYERISFESTTSAGDPAFEWSYLDGNSGTYKVDLFVFRGGDGFAVLGEATSRAGLREVKPIAASMLDSISPN